MMKVPSVSWMLLRITVTATATFSFSWTFCFGPLFVCVKATPFHVTWIVTGSSIHSSCRVWVFNSLLSTRLDTRESWRIIRGTKKSPVTFTFIFHSSLARHLAPGSCHPRRLHSYSPFTFTRCGHFFSFHSPSPSTQGPCWPQLDKVQLRIWHPRSVKKLTYLMLLHPRLMATLPTSEVATCGI